MPIPHEAANRSTTVDPAKWLAVLQRWHPRMPREELVGFINEFIEAAGRQRVEGLDALFIHVDKTTRSAQEKFDKLRQWNKKMRSDPRFWAEFGRMIALDPNFAQGHTAAGMALVYSGRATEALEPIARAMRLDPHYAPIGLHFLAQANFSLGAYDTAARLLLERIARNPGTDASRMLLASCYGHLGRAEDARITWAGLLKVNPDFSLEQRARVLPYKDP